MANFFIIENGLASGDTYDTSLAEHGISRFRVRFTADNGQFIEHEHEVASTDPEIIQEQLKITLSEYNKMVTG